MKILFLTPWYPDEENPNHGIFIREQAVALSRYHEVVVISAKINYKKFGLSSCETNESAFQNVKEHRLVVCHSLPIYNQLNYFLISMSIARKIAAEFKPDIVHGNIGYPGGFLAWLVGRTINRPFIITEHTFIYNNFRSIVHKALTLFAMRRAAAIVTVSTKAADEIKKYVNVRVDVIPNIVDVSRYSIEPYPNDQVAIGFLGSLDSAKKGLDATLKATSAIKAEFTLQVGGAGAMMDSYIQLATQLNISSKCKFLGFVQPGRVPEFMNQLSFFVNTSRFESFGIAVVEALASGLPVVCYDNGGPSDFVDRTNGVLVENQNEKKLKEAIEWMLKNYQTYDRNKIRASVVGRFSSDAFVDRMSEIYKRVTTA